MRSLTQLEKTVSFAFFFALVAVPTVVLAGVQMPPALMPAATVIGWLVVALVVVLIAAGIAYGSARTSDARREECDPARYRSRA